MAHFPPWPPASASPSTHPSAYPPPPPPPLPNAAQNMVLPPELHALNITPQQVAALLTHLQAGTLPFPPPPPPPPQAFASAVPYSSVPVPPPPPVQNLVSQDQAARSSIPSHAESDREEGEASDAPRDAGYPPSVPVSRKRKLRSSQSGQHATAPTTKYPAPTINDTNPTDVSLQQKKEAVLPFIAALHQEGFTFAEFLREGFEEGLLRQVYQELRIPTHAPALEQPTTTQLSLEQSAPPKPLEHLFTQPSTTISPQEPKPAAPAKPAAPMSRQDYLARLQAAKTKKAEAVPPKQPVQPTSSVASSSRDQSTADMPVKPLLEAQSQPGVAKVASAQASRVQNKQSQTTELIRKKMEALKATQRRFANSTTPTPSTPSMQVPSQTVNQSQSKSVPTPPTASTSNTPSFFGQSGGASLIPGLRMSTPAAIPPQPDSQVPPAVSAASSSSTASTNVSKSVTPQLTDAGSVLTTRKRPVASDLNGPHTVVEQRPFKRPFGQSRRNSLDEGMIIEVSDDEDASDDDHELSKTKPTAKPSVTLTGQRDKNIRDLPHLRDFPQRSAFSKPPGISTPSLNTPGISSDAEELRKKELEITSLNLRIKEFEKKKAALRAKAHLTQSQSQTPSQAVSNSEKTTALPTPILASATMPASTEKQSKQPSDRRTEIKAALTARDADIVGQKARILEMQRQVAEMQKQYEEDMAKQQKLREELEGLDVNTEGMTQSEMEAKKQELDDMLEVERSNTATSNTPPTGPTSNEFFQDATRQIQESTADVEHKDDTDISMSEGDSDISSDEEPETGARHGVSQELSRQGRVGETPSSPGRARVLEDIRADRAKTEQTRTSISESSSESDEGSSMSESSDSDDEEDDLPHSNSQIPVDTSTNAESSSEMIDSLSKPASAQTELEEPADEPVWLYMRNLPWTVTKNDVRSFFNAFDVKRVQLPKRNDGRGLGHGFVSLRLSQAVAAIDQLNGLQLQNRKIFMQMSKLDPDPAPSSSPGPTAASSDDSSSDDEMDISDDSDEESEEDNTSSVLAATNKPSETAQADGSASVEETSSSDEDLVGEDDHDDDDRMDLESSNASSREYSPEPAVVSVSSAAQSHFTSNNEHNIADDLAPELQPHNGVSDAVNNASPSEAPSKSTFKPYESVLKSFKGYRFHPDYPQEVQGGYRSLTYSHQIDPNKELCRYEVASGVCNDVSCEYQHFRDMAVSDDTLLLQMGIQSGNPSKTAEEDARYKDGLRAIIQEMRGTGNLEAEAVATRVAQYRREFIQDPTNILGL